jgi:predicted CopG family antitoxin
MKQKRQRGGFQNEEREQHQRRMKGIIANMIDVSDSKDSDIIEVIKNEHKEDQTTKYTKKEAEQILKEFYLFNAEKVLKTKNGFRSFPSDLLKQYINKNQTGGNRVTLPLTFFTGEIPNQIAVPTRVDNYCDTF